MARANRWRFRLPQAAFLVSLAGGCLGGPADFSRLDQEPIVAGLPQACRNHVHVFILEGFDVVQETGPSNLREYLICQGYIKTYLAPAFYYPWYVCEIRRLHKEDPKGRFVLIGFDSGCDLADAVAHKVRAIVPIDLEVRIDPGSEQQRIDNARIVLNLKSKELWDGMPDVQQATKPGAPPANMPHPVVLANLVRQLGHVAGDVRIPGAAPLETLPRPTPLKRTPETLPRPTPLNRKPAPASDAEELEWGVAPDSLSRDTPASALPILSAPSEKQPELHKPTIEKSKTALKEPIGPMPDNPQAKGK